MGGIRAYLAVGLMALLVATGASAQSSENELKTDIETASVTITADDVLELTAYIENIRAKSDAVGASRFLVEVIEKPSFLQSVEIPDNGQIDVLATQKDANIKLVISPQKDGPKSEGVLKLKISAVAQETLPKERLVLVPITFEGKVDVKPSRTIISIANYWSSENIQDDLGSSTGEIFEGELQEAGHERQRYRIGITNEGDIRQRPLTYTPPVPEQGSGEYQEFVVDVVRRLAFAPPDEIVVGEPYSVRVCASVDMVYVAGDEPLTKKAKAQKLQLILNAYLQVQSSSADADIDGVAPPAKREGNKNARHVVDLDWPGVGQAKSTRAEITFQASPLAGEFKDRRRKAYKFVISEGEKQHEALDTYVLGGEMTSAELSWAGRATTGVFGIPEREFDPFITNVVATQFTIKDAVRASDAAGSVKFDRKISFRYDVPEDGVAANVLRDAPFARGDDLCAPADLVPATGSEQDDGATVLQEVPPYLFFVVRETGGLVGFKSENMDDTSSSGYTATYSREWVLRVEKGQTVADALRALGVLDRPKISCGGPGGPNTGRSRNISWRTNSGPLIEIVSGPYLQHHAAAAEAGEARRVVSNEMGGGPSYDDWRASQCPE